MTDLDQHSETNGFDGDLARLGAVAEMSGDVHARSNARFRAHLAAAESISSEALATASDEAAAEVVPLRRRARHRTIRRVATVGGAAAAIALITIAVPDGSGVVGTRPASASVRLERAAARIGQTAAPRLPMRLDVTMTYDDPVPGHVPSGKQSARCSLYVLGVEDTIVDCEVVENSYSMMFNIGAPGAIAKVVFSESPDAAVAALDSVTRASLEQRLATGETVTEAVVRGEILAGALMVPQMGPDIRAALVRQLRAAADLRATTVAIPGGPDGTRFVASYGGGWQLALTVDDGGYVRDLEYLNPSDTGGSVKESSVAMDRPVNVDRLPDEIAATATKAGIATDAAAGGSASSSSSAETMATMCTVAPGETVPGRLISAVHCSSPS